MTRAEIEEKLNYVKKESIVNPKDGDCYELNHSSIKEQLLGLGEGRQKVFFLKVESSGKQIEYEEGKFIPEINLRLVSEEVYISATKYV